jgi:hypothetical protein
MVNALGNIKRAIDCRVACLLVYFGLYATASREHWSFPKSAGFLVKTGVIAPEILIKINSKRNKLEHEFKKPTMVEVKDYFDVANLFMSFTNQFLHKYFTDFEFYDSSIPGYVPNASIYLYSDKGLIKIDYETLTGHTEIDITIQELEIYPKLLSYLVHVILNR